MKDVFNLIKWKTFLISSKAFSILLLTCCLIAFWSCKKDSYNTIKENSFLQGRGFGITNIALNVKDMDSARNYFKKSLGFSLAMSPKPEKGVINGTITSPINFPNMTSIELLAVVDSISVSESEFLLLELFKGNEGIKSYTLSSSSLDSTRNWLSSQGFKMDTIGVFEKLNTFSRQKSWDEPSIQLLNLRFKDSLQKAYLPEFSELPSFPYERMHEWNSFYIMQRGYMKHPNGALGVSAIKVVVNDIATVRAEFLKMGFKESNDSLNKNEAHFKLNLNQNIQLIEPNTNDELLLNILKEHGQSVYGLVIEVKNITETHSFLSNKLPKQAINYDSVSKALTIPNKYAFGLQLELKQESESQALIANKLNLNYGTKLDSIARDNANQLYQKYCALCHGKNREGYAADNAPSLRSHSLLATSKDNNFLRYTTQYGREGTAMAGYYEELGGPLSLIEIELLLKWLNEEAGVEESIKLSREPVSGDIELGARIYKKYCITCHGKEGEGISAPALGNPMLLATATDDFLRYAIKEGRDSTLMVPYKDILTDVEINGVTAFLRSRASGWNTPSLDSITEPLPEDYILNPLGKTPDFNLREGRYVSAKEINQALKDSLRLIILDARSKVAWRQTHIPGSIPVPYYEEPEKFVKHIPNDSTWIVAYCACPHAASGKVIDKLNKLGYTKTAILDEGILVWAQKGYPVKHGH